MGELRWGSFVTLTVMPIHFGAPMDENPPGVEPSVIFTATCELSTLADPVVCSGEVNHAILPLGADLFHDRP